MISRFDPDWGVLIMSIGISAAAIIWTLVTGRADKRRYGPDSNTDRPVATKPRGIY